MAYTGDFELEMALGPYRPDNGWRRTHVIDVEDKYVPGYGAGAVFHRVLDPVCEASVLAL